MPRNNTHRSKNPKNNIYIYTFYHSVMIEKKCRSIKKIYSKINTNIRQNMNTPSYKIVPIHVRTLFQSIRYALTLNRPFYLRLVQ